MNRPSIPTLLSLSILALAGVLPYARGQAQEPAQQPAAEAEKSIVAVFDILAPSGFLSYQDLEALTSYLADRISQSSCCLVIPPERLRAWLAKKERESPCEGGHERCRMEFGRELSASYMVSTTIGKKETKCGVSTVFSDLRRSETFRISLLATGCQPGVLVDSVEALAGEILKAMTREEPAEPAPEEARPPIKRKMPAEPFVRQQEPVGRPQEPQTGWALEAGILGLVGAGATLGLAIGAEMYEGDRGNKTPLALGVASTGVAAASGVLVAIGGASARFESRAQGSRGLWITGWVSYGIGVGFGLVNVLLEYFTGRWYGWDEYYSLVPGAVATLSLTMFSLNAFVARNQVIDLRSRTAQAEDGSSGVRLAPVISPIRRPDGALGVQFGLVGQF